MVSIIVPIYNEEKMLSENTSFFKEIAEKGELIFVDGDSIDKSASIAKDISLVIKSKKGRAAQMNCGAKIAKGGILFFLHADTRTSTNALKLIEEKIENAGFIGGCLTQKIDRIGITYRLIEGFGNLRARTTKIFYGDQGIFIRKDMFSKTGGFPEVPILEDALLSRTLRKLGRTLVLPDKIFVSPRRWEKKGIRRTAILYSLINILFLLRVPLGQIKRLYGDLR